MRRCIHIISIVPFFFIAVWVRFFVLVAPVYAATSCTASVDVHSVTTISQNTFNFELINNGDTHLAWVKLTRPSSNFSADAEFTSTPMDIAPGDASYFATNSTTGTSEAASADWVFMVSDNADGSGAVQCTGDLGTTIAGIGVDTFPPNQSPITVSDISDTQATFTWTTDEPATSKVAYGTTDSYGSEKADATLTTTHSVTLDGLTANTTYYFNIISADALNNIGQNGGHVFTTAKAGLGTTTTVTVEKTVIQTNTNTVTIVITPAPTAVPTPVPTPIPDTKPPTVTLTNDLSKPFLQAPEITGTSSDEKGMKSVEYSIDSGNHWFPIDQQFEPGTKEVKFTFTPLGLLDGNYAIKIRAQDINKNVKTTDATTLIIDRLPPRLGTSVFSIGSLLLTPQADGVIYTVKGLSPQLTFSAVGGPIQSTIYAGVRSFALEKREDTGLWSTKLGFEYPGAYDLASHLVDGVGNATDQKVGRVQVVNSGKALFDGKAVANAVMSVYTFNQNTFSFELWDGKSVGQANPQLTNASGEYVLLLPPGKYYIAIEALGLRTLRSDIFTVAETTPIVQDFQLERRRELQIGSLHMPLFDWFQTQAVVSTKLASSDAKESSLIGKEFPFFDLPGLESQITLDDLKGKPTILTVLSTWAPQSASQLQIMQTLQNKESIHTAVIMMHESSSAMNVYTKRAGYTIPMIVDSDGVLSEAIGVPVAPTHYFLNQRGIVRSIKSGVLSKEEILDNLIN